MSGRLAFLLSTDDGFSHRVHVTDDAGRGLRRLTNQRAQGRPAFSPDGQRVVFPGPLSDDSDGRFCLYTVNVDGTGLRRITAPRVCDLDPAWSPDGRSIAFVRDPVGAMNPSRYRLMVMPAGGGSQVQRVSTPGAREPAWSPDGSQIAFTALGVLYVVRADGTGLRTLAGGNAKFPTWSPDGRTIAYVQRLSADRSRLATVPATGGGVTVRADFGRQIEDPVWSSDGSTLLCVVYIGQGWDGRRDAALWRVVGGQGQLLARFAYPVIRLAHHRDPVPGPISDLVPLDLTQRTVRLRWTNPPDADLESIAVRVVTGETPVTSPTIGYPAFVGYATEALITGLTAGTTHSFSVFARDASGGWSAPVTLTLTTPPPAVPAPPLHPDAVPGTTSVRVTWDPPLNDGGRPITGWSVSLDPGGMRLDLPSDAREAVFTGLHTGPAYTATIFAINELGASAPAVAGPVTPDSGAVEGTYTQLTPTRLLDTRQAGARVTPTADVRVPVAGRAGVPAAGAIASVVTLTATNAVGAGHLTAWAAGATRPDVSSLNYAAGRTVANLDAVTTSAEGLAIGVGGAAAHALVDIAGFYATAGGPAGGRLNAVTPSRLVDTRTTGGPVQGGTVLPVTVLGRGGVPASGVGSVVLVVTAVTPSAATHLTVYASDELRPGTSVLNASRGDTVAVLVVARPGADGRIAVYNAAGDAHVVVDVMGYHTATANDPGELFVPLAARIVDSRQGVGMRTGPLRTGEIVVVGVAGAGGVPTGTRTALVNITSVLPSAATHLTVYPGDTVPPSASVLNTLAGITRANLVLAKLDDQGRLAVRNAAGRTHVLVDVRGYYRR